MKEFIKKGTRFLATTELVTLKCLWLYYEVIVIDYQIGNYDIIRHQGLLLIMGSSAICFLKRKHHYIFWNFGPVSCFTIVR